MPQPHPKQIGEDIDRACELLEKSIATMGRMKTIEITISIPQGERTPKTRKVLEKIADILEERLTECEGSEWVKSHRTIADVLGIGDTVPTLTAGKHVVEITL